MITRDPELPIPIAARHHAGFWLHFVSNLITRRLASLLAEQGVSHTEYLALQLLGICESATPWGLGQYLGITKGAVSKLLDRLEREGLVERRLADGSARFQWVYMKGAGRELLSRLAALDQDNEAFFFELVPSAQRDALIGTLMALAHRNAPYAVPMQASGQGV